MGIRLSLKRVAKLEDVMHPQSDGMWTLEELCRSMWREDKKKFKEMAQNSNYQLFVYQFEREDAEAASINRAGVAGRVKAR